MERAQFPQIKTGMKREFNWRAGANARLSAGDCLHPQQLCKGEHPRCCCCQNSVRHPGRTSSNNLGSQDWPPTSLPRVGKGAEEFLRAAVWTRRPLGDKPPIDHRLTVTARGSGQCPSHICLLLSFLDGATDESEHGCAAVRFTTLKISFIWAQGATVLPTELGRRARNAPPLLASSLPSGPSWVR